MSLISICIASFSTKDCDHETAMENFSFQKVNLLAKTIDEAQPINPKIGAIAGHCSFPIV